MRDLILHIGLPKTGTTSLQDVLQRRHPNYHGKRRPDVGPQRPSEFGRFYVRGGDPVRRDSTSWPVRLFKWWQRASHQGRSDVLVSDEVLSAWPTRARGRRFSSWPVSAELDDVELREGTHPAVGFVRDVSMALGGHARVRVAVVLRSQPELLGSLFAQLSALDRRASQGVFDSNISRILAKGEPFLDYHGLVSGLAGEVGISNLSIHLFEDGLESVAVNLFEFMGIPPTDAMPEGALPIANRRSSASGVWQLRPQSLARRLVARYGRFGRWIPARTRYQIVRWSAQLGSNCKARTIPGQVVLSPVQREAILASVAESNIRLGNLLQRNIRDVGYLG